MSKVEKLLDRMRRTKADWKSKDLKKLYLGFGFEKREGRKHTMYIHPTFPELSATVTRHGGVAKGYISTAVKLIDRLKKRKGVTNAK